MTTKGVTPSQTVGPFFHPSMLHADVPQHQLVRPDTVGERIRIEGRVLDGILADQRRAEERTDGLRGGEAVGLCFGHEGCSLGGSNGVAFGPRRTMSKR